MNNNTYTGIGSRETPSSVLLTLGRIAIELAHVDTSSIDGAHAGCGDDFGLDGWIRNSARSRPQKWFSPRVGWKHFWHPVLEQIPRLEQLYYRAGTSMKIAWTRMEMAAQVIRDDRPMEPTKWLIPELAPTPTH